jgi:hypothetical protein
LGYFFLVLGAILISIMSEAHKDTGYSKEPNSETIQKIKDILAAKKPSNPASEDEYRPPTAEEKAAAKKGLVEARKALADAQARAAARNKS